MSEPKRLRDSAGPAGVLMGGANALRVPSAARRRALAFTGTAAGLAASTGVAAASTSLLKSFVICVAVGAAGGGVVSLVASETASRLETPPAPAATHGEVASPRAAAPVPVPAAPLPEAPAAKPPVEPAPTPPASALAPAPPPSHSKVNGPSEPAAPAVVAPAQPGSSLFEEQRFIESARSAVARGDSRGALSALDAYDRAFARKQFGPEALALRVEALLGNGQIIAARALAEDFARYYPNHPLLARVQAAVQR